MNQRMRVMLLYPFFFDDDDDGDLIFPMLFQAILLFHSGCRHAVAELQKTCVALAERMA